MSGPNRPPNQPNDRELQDFLDGHGELRAAYHADAQEQSPAAVDDAILRMATKAVVVKVDIPQRPRVQSASFNPWKTSLAAAAVLVLSFGAFLQIRKDPIVERAVFEPAIQQAEIAAAPPAMKAQSASPSESRQRALARAQADVAQRQQREKKEVSTVADATVGMAMAAAPAPVVESELASSMAAEDNVAAKDAVGAGAQAFAMQDAAPAPAPSPPAAAMAKSIDQQRAAPMGRMAAAPAMAAAESSFSASAASMSEAPIHRWLNTCSAEALLAVPSRDDAGLFAKPQLWNGLPVVAIVGNALVFDASVSQETILAQWGATKNAAACLKPAQTAGGLSLHCGCIQP